MSRIAVAEALRRVGFGRERTDSPVTERPGEAPGRGSERQGQQAADVAQRLSLDRVELAAPGIAQAESITVQERRDRPHQAGIVHTVVDFGHGLLRNQSVFGDEVCGVGEMAAVADGLFEKPLVHAAVDGAAAVGDHIFKEMVRLLEDIPELAVGLRKFERLHIVAGDHLGPQDVER